MTTDYEALRQALREANRLEREMAAADRAELVKLRAENIALRAANALWAVARAAEDGDYPIGEYPAL